MRLVVGALQLSGVPGPRTARLERIATLLSNASRRGVCVAVLPEVAVSGYMFGVENFRDAEPVPGPTVFELAALARHHDLVIVAGLIERVRSTYYDTLVVVDRHGYRGRYRKLHVSGVENAYWTKGERAQPVDTVVGRIGLGVCADMAYRTPWDWYRRSELHLIAVGSAWPDLRDLRPFHLGVRTGMLHHACTRMLPEKISDALGVPFIYANSCGPVDLRLPVLGCRVRGRFAGGSRIVDQTTLSEAGESDEEWVVAELDIGRRTPNLAAWVGPWLPQATTWQRFQIYAGDRIPTLFYRALYHLWARRRSAVT